VKPAVQTDRPVVQAPDGLLYRQHGYAQVGALMLRESLGADRVQMQDFQRLLLGLKHTSDSCISPCTDRQQPSNNKNLLSLSLFKRDQSRFFDSQKFVY